MHLSLFDMFTIGIGPSSSHTVGPMRAARRFVDELDTTGLLARVSGLKVELFGSLGHTGKGHGSDLAVLLGLEGERPEEVDPDTAPARVEAIRAAREVRLLGWANVPFEPADLVFHRRRSLPVHPNGMRFTAQLRALPDASAAADAPPTEVSRIYYSVGGGFVVDDGAVEPTLPGVGERPRPPFRFANGAELLALTEQHGLSISTLMLENERALRSESELREGLGRIVHAMQRCVQRGCEREGILPGGLKVRRRAAALHRKLTCDTRTTDPLVAMDWVNLWALAVNEENAAGGRVVTAPTNGAAGILPAVLHYYLRFIPNAGEDGAHRFLLTAAAIGTLYKRNASISGAEVGCQGEVGVACSMAAAGLAEVLGGTPEQVENAAEIGMEHNLGLTCDPVGGLVQVPCIERNAMASVKAINAARLALSGDGKHSISLDKVIATMRQTGADMMTKYKETARGGLAVNIIEC